jgi:mono/diheme cytochrome c family protein
MRHISGCLLLAALTANGQIGTIAVYTQFQHEPSKAMLGAMQQEATSLMSPAGLRLQWKTLPATGRDVATALAVVQIQGRCSANGLPAQPHWETRLGWSQVNEGTVLPFATVDCDSIVGFVYDELRREPVKERDRVLGRAIGRVLAHELDHIFAESTGHRNRDVDEPEYSVEDLLAPSLSSEEARTHILRLAPATAGAAKPGSPLAGASEFTQAGCGACHGEHGEGSAHGPVLRAAGRVVNAVMLATRLTRSERKMCERATALKLPAPALDETEIQDVVSFLNHADQQR